MRSLTTETTRDTVREQVMVAVHDTIREVTTITVATNESGDTLKVVQVTDREKSSQRDRVREKEEKLTVVRDTVYVAVRDSVYVETLGAAGGDGTGKKSNFVLALKWIFWIILGLTALTIVIKFKKL